MGNDKTCLFPSNNQTEGGEEDATTSRCRITLQSETSVYNNISLILLAPPRKLNHPRGEFNREASGAQRAVCLCAVSQQTNSTNGHEETQNARFGRGKKPKQNQLLNMATPPKRANRGLDSPRQDSSFARRWKKISIEGNIGEFSNIGAVIAYLKFFNRMSDRKPFSCLFCQRMR